MKILFICKYNRFRSRIAAEYFKKINKNKKIRINSAGLIKGSPVNPEVIKIAKQFGINISGKTKGLSSDLLKKQDLIINVANDVPNSIFKSKVKKIILWKIPDVTKVEKKQIIKIINQIIKKTKEFNNLLEGKNENR